jgi:vitamin B12 transporter
MKQFNISLIASAILSTNIYANINDAHITVSSATKSEQSIKDVTSDIEVITGAELEANNFTTIVDALNFANLNVNQSGGIGQTSSFFLSGMSAEHTLVMVDGIRYNDPTVTNGYALLDQLMISDIDKIEIIKGAQSGIWGADASAGVINIITKKGKKGLHSNIGIEYGSFNTLTNKSAISYKTDRYYAKINYAHIKSDGFTAMADKNKDIKDYEDDKYENKTLSLKGGFNINETNKIDISHISIDANGDYDSQFSGKGDDKTSQHTTKNSFTSINYNHIDSFNTLNMYVKQSKFDRTIGAGEYIGSTQELALKSKISYNKSDFVVWGVDRKTQTMEKSNSVLNGEYNNQGLFATNQNKFKDGKTIFTQSLRYDQYDNFKNKTTGKLGLKHYHKFLKGFVASANYGTAYKTPSLFNLYAQYGGNRNLIPESISSFDIILEYKNAKIKYFTSTIDDEILYSNNTYNYYQSTKQSKYKGYELSYKKAIKTLLLKLKYTTLSAKNKDNKDLERRAKQTMNISADYVGIRKLHLNITAQYVGERFDDLAKTKQTGKYTLINTVANYKLHKKTKIYLKINNITNKKYQMVDGYATSPRAYYVGIKHSF